MGFIRKVYGILLTQLMVTAGGVALVLYVEGVGTFLEHNPWIIILSLIIYLVSFLTLACFRSIARRVPINYILLSIFTLSMTVMVMASSAMYERKIVFAAAFITGAMVAGLTLYAFYSKTDFTLMGGALFAAFFILMAVGFMSYLLNSQYSPEN